MSCILDDIVENLELGEDEMSEGRHRQDDEWQTNDIKQRATHYYTCNIITRVYLYQDTFETNDDHNLINTRPSTMNTLIQDTTNHYEQHCRNNEGWQDENGDLQNLPSIRFEEKQGKIFIIDEDTNEPIGTIQSFSEFQDFLWENFPEVSCEKCGDTEGLLECSCGKYYHQDCIDKCRNCNAMCEECDEPIKNANSEICEEKECKTTIHVKCIKDVQQKTFSTKKRRPTFDKKKKKKVERHYKCYHHTDNPDHYQSFGHRTCEICHQDWEEDYTNCSEDKCQRFHCDSCNKQKVDFLCHFHAQVGQKRKRE